MQYTDMELAEIFLASCPRMNPRLYEKIVSVFDDALTAVREGNKETLSFLGKEKEAVVSHLADKDGFRRFLKRLREMGIFCLTRSSDSYPGLLREIDDAPILLYARGHADVPFDLSVTVIGTRHPTRYGEKVTRMLAEELAENGVTVVSGLAVGLDGIALSAAAEKGTPTVGVVAGGVDTGIPSDNRELAEKILENGLILSEYPPGMPVQPWMFAARNRIMSGLSHGTLIVQGREKSGTLLTADHAQEQGRTVFAVPGEITEPASYWPNHLIAQGAVPVLEARDILDEFGWKTVEERKSDKEKLDLSKFGEEERMILLALGKGSLSREEISYITNLSNQKVLAYLTTLELEGIIEQFPGRTVALCDRYRPQ